MKIGGKQFLIIGSFLSGLGVGLGAIGAHALKPILETSNRTEAFEIAVRYQLYHGLALILVGILCFILKDSDFSTPGLLMLAGVILFSLSLYLVCLTELKWVVFVTPVGGLLMISGWLFLIVKIWKTGK